MQGPKLFLFFPLKIGDDQKKGFHVRRCRILTVNMVKTKKKNLRCS